MTNWTAVAAAAITGAVGLSGAGFDRRWRRDQAKKEALRASAGRLVAAALTAGFDAQMYGSPGMAAAAEKEPWLARAGHDNLRQQAAALFAAKAELDILSQDAALHAAADAVISAVSRLGDLIAEGNAIGDPLQKGRNDLKSSRIRFEGDVRRVLEG